jgi:predicted dehydrogenase
MRSRTVWQKHIAESPGLELAGVQDVAQESLDKALEERHVDASRTFLDLGAMLAETKPDALLVAPIHSAHAAAVQAGLEAGCHVLVEKPFATEYADAVRLTELAEERGLLVGVVQNWRTKSAGLALRKAIAEDAIGRVSHIFFRYLRDRELPHLPDYLFDEADPLLYAMTIHHIDLFRFALGQEIVRVDGHAFHPPWSRYREPSVNQLWMETDGGVVIAYTATFSSRNAHLPIESLQVEGERGTVYNDSAYFEPPLMISCRGEDYARDLTAGVDMRDQLGQYVLADTAILDNFRQAAVEGEPLIAPARDNLGTLAALEAARTALRGGGPVALS